MRKILTAGIFLSMILFSSCLKDKYQPDIVDNTSRIIAEFTNGSSTQLNSLAVDFGTSFIEVDLAELRIPPRSVVSKNVTVKIQTNPTLVADYNTANGTAYEVAPATVYQLPTVEFTLSPNSKKTNVKIRVNPSLMAGHSYALGFTISNISEGEISTLKKDYIVELKVKNAYEGLYLASGTLTRYSGATTSTPVVGVLTIDEEKNLTTVDQTTVESEMGVYAFTGGFMFLKVDPVTNNVTVSPSLLSPAFPTTAGTGTYDPATKTFTLSYQYFNGAGALRVIQETLVLE